MPTSTPPDGSWLDNPRTVKSVLMFLISKLSPADAEELDAQLTGDGTATAMDARLDTAPDLKRDWLKYAPRERKALRNALRDPRAKALGLDEDPFKGKSFDEMFPDANRLKI